MKKFLSLLLVVMLSPAVPSALAGISTESYVYLTQKHIVQGVGNTGDLKLGDEINRAELMKIVVTAALGEAPQASTYNNCFTDVHKEWFAPYICWAKQEGYVNGYEDGSFHPEKKVTEAEALKVIHEVFHLPTEHFLALKNGTWYAPYLDAGRKNGILLNGVEERLHKNALRADIFEEVSRAITLQETGNNTYSSADTKKLLADTNIPPLSDAQMHLFSLIKETIAYGMQNQIADGTGALHVKLSGNDFIAHIQIDIKELDKLTGTSNEMDKAQSDIDITTRIEANGAGETMNVEVKATATLMLDSKKGIFMKLLSFSIDPKDSSDSIKEIATEIESSINPHKDIWYSAPLDTLGMSEEALMLSQGGKKQVMEFVDTLMLHLMHKANFLLVSEEVQSVAGVNVPQYTISIDEEIFNKSIPDLIKALSPEKHLNHFQIRAELNALRPYLKKVFANTSIQIWANEENSKITKSITRLLPIAFIFPKDTQVFSIDTVLLDFLAEGTYTYPLSIEITTPENSTPLFEDIGTIQ